MKRLALPLLFLLSPAASAQWTLPGVPVFKENPDGIFTSVATLKKGAYPLRFETDNQCWQPASAPKLNQMLSLQPCGSQSAIDWRLYRDGEYQIKIDTRSGTPTVLLSVKVPAVSNSTNLTQTCPQSDGKPLTVDVSKTFKDGETLRDYYSGQTATVQQGKITLQPSRESSGLLLLEPVSTTEKAPFNWHNATVYFALTDRFANGNPANDHSYDRKNDGQQEIATFHGGDLAGLTGKLDYLQQLGVNALWISSPLEQIHGWIGGGTNGDFPHYAYHGYYALDWTKLDANMGTEQELHTLVEQAHKRGIRILFDVVMNHVGYATLADMQEFQFGALHLKADEQKQLLGERWTNWQPGKGENWHSFNNFINFSEGTAWENWWGKKWIRSGIGNYDNPGYDDLTMSLAFLPDVKTEATQASGLPNFYRYKKDTNAKEIAGYAPRDYITHWLSQWVRDYGIDGFRVDTAKHVEKPAWDQLKTQATQALAEWKKSAPAGSTG